MHISSKSLNFPFLQMRISTFWFISCHLRFGNLFSISKGSSVVLSFSLTPLSLSITNQQPLPPQVVHLPTDQTSVV